jgi:hypothetical protein
MKEENKEEVFNENQVLEKLSQSKTQEEANFYLDELLQDSFRDKGADCFSKIEGCVNILANNEKEFSIKDLIISRLLQDFYPIAKVSDEVIEIKQITKVANSLGKIIIEYDEKDSYRNKCKEAFFQTITLNEKTNNGKRKTRR